MPTKLVSIIGRAEFDESLGTSDYEAAKVKAAVRNAEIALRFRSAQSEQEPQRVAVQAAPASHVSAVTPELAKAISQGVYAADLAQDEAARDSPEGRTALMELAAHTNIYRNLLLGSTASTEVHYMDGIPDDAAEVLAALNGLQEGSTAMALARRKLALVVPRADAVARGMGLVIDWTTDSAKQALRLSLEELRRAHKGRVQRDLGELVATPPAPAAAPIAGLDVPPTGLLLGAVIDDYTDNLKETGFTRKVRRCLQLFGEMVGRDTPVKDLKQPMVTGFLRDICKLPSEWAKPYDSGMSIADLLARGADKVMSPTTYVDNYRAPLGTFLKASLRDHGDDGFPARSVEGIDYSGNRKADEDQQRRLSVEELRTVYEGAAFAAIAEDPGQESLYWAAVVLLFTGARPRELFQTNPQSDFGQEGGHWFMDLSEHTPAGVGVTKSIKTGEARRIPFHSELVRLGFPEYVQRVKEQGADRLFPSLRIKAGNPYTAHGELFSDLLRACGVYTREAPPGELVTGAYTLRKTFITQCRNQGVVSKEITGHSDGTTTAVQDRHYIFGPEPFAKKLAELQKLVMPVQIPKRGASR